MAGRSAFDGGRIYRRSTNPWLYFLAGLVLGVVVGCGAALMLLKPVSTPPAATPVAMQPTPVPLPKLRLTAQPPRGLLLSTAGTLKLTGSGASELATQKGRAVFVGVRNWSRTAGYLTGGDAVLFLRDADNVKITGGWKATDYRRFVHGQPLQMSVKPNARYTLYFRRESSDEVDLGSFETGTLPPGASSRKPAATIAPAE